MEAMTEKEWFTTDELIRWLGLGRTKTYELLRSGEIPSYKIGRVRRIRRRDIEDWLERNRCHFGDGSQRSFGAQRSASPEVTQVSEHNPNGHEPVGSPTAS